MIGLVQADFNANSGDPDRMLRLRSKVERMTTLDDSVRKSWIEKIDAVLDKDQF
jgi:hypothetical protein